MLGQLLLQDIERKSGDAGTVAAPGYRAQERR